MKEPLPAQRDASVEDTSTRHRILVATAEVLARSGQTKLSLSEVALQAGVSRPTLYRWFADKQELLDAMATTVLTDTVEDGWPDLPWPEFLHAYANGLRQALLRYRDGAKMVPGTYLT
ncbi:MAG: TetR/AcrR family transcriptional regulator, partial [Actinomycetes bacterium]